MSIKCLKNTWQEIFYTSIFTPIMKHNLNAPQERNDSFATSNKMFENPRLSTVKLKNISKQPSHFGLYLRRN